MMTIMVVVVVVMTQVTDKEMDEVVAAAMDAAVALPTGWQMTVLCPTSCTHPSTRKEDSD